jgi:enolase 1/2/3
MSAAITRIHARQVLDSRGNPTVEVEVLCNGGRGRAIVPSGASTGHHEAVELRDGDPAHFGGKGVRKAVANVINEIAPPLIGCNVTDQANIDRLMIQLDGTPNKSRLGANSILGVSLACAHGAANVRGVPLWKHLDRDGRAKLPVPMVNMISGGLHAGGNLDFQDFLLIPIGATTYSEALAMAVRVYRELGRLLDTSGYEGVLVGDEGGYGPTLEFDELAAQWVVRAIEAAGLRPGEDAALAVDVASTHFFQRGVAQYRLATSQPAEGGFVSSLELTTHLSDLTERYPIVSIEDGCAEDDWLGWRHLTDRLGAKIQLIGDDLFCTNPQRLQRGIDNKVANSILIKPNQIGTLTETLEVIDLARRHGYRPVISARSGETEDSTISDLAVATGVGQIKIGSVARSERLAKYNQLLRIEEELPGPEHFARWQPLGSAAH